MKLQESKLNRIFYYTRCITSKRVTSWRSSSPRHCALATQLLSKKYCSGASPWQHCCRFDCPRFEPQTSRSRGERVTARPTGWVKLQEISRMLSFILLFQLLELVNYDMVAEKIDLKRFAIMASLAQKIVGLE